MIFRTVADFLAAVTHQYPFLNVHFDKVSLVYILSCSESKLVGPTLKVCTLMYLDSQDFKLDCHFCWKDDYFLEAESNYSFIRNIIIIRIIYLCF